ncbi:hypothetical protein [Streptomyces sp. NPDC001508]|uniref:hypothetical protein n=1 Tax=Streptomyces sp. NPDC001508 TaxID=3154656 RepID=UPI00332A8448
MIRSPCACARPSYTRREKNAPVALPDTTTWPSAGRAVRDLVVRAGRAVGRLTGPAASAVRDGPDGPTRPGVRLSTGGDVAIGRFGRGPALDAAIGGLARARARAAPAVVPACGPPCSLHPPRDP